MGGTGLLSGVVGLTTDDLGFCGLLASGGVDCWGDGQYGQLGNGQFYPTSYYGSNTPVEVEGVGGNGVLADVTSLSTDENGYCAVLSLGGVVCWGYGFAGQLGNGQFYMSGNLGSAVPVQVEGVGSAGTLSGVISLAPSGGGEGLEGASASYCALLNTGGVDCWGDGGYGELGNGQVYSSSPYGSASPVQVEGVGGIGILSSVTSLTDDLWGYCAVLTSGGVDCWGNGVYGVLGDGSGSDSASPVQVEGVGGSGTLSGVSGLTTGSDSPCARLNSGGVDCWGYGIFGQLGNGSFSNSVTPVQVENVLGTGNLSGVSGLVPDSAGVVSGLTNTFCALLTSGQVDCWGLGDDGQLGDGQFYNSGNQGSAGRPG